MSGNWLAIVSADHVRRGHSGGFMQVCHRLRGRYGASPQAMAWFVTRRPTALAPGTACAPSPPWGVRRAAIPTSSTWAAVSVRFGAMSTGRPPERCRSHRCSTGLTSPQAVRTGVISCALGSVRSANTTFCLIAQAMGAAMASDEVASVSPGAWRYRLSAL